MQGSFLDNILLNRVKKIKNLENYNFSIRKHPFSEINFNFNNLDNFFLSEEKNIYEDIKKSDLVIHHQTSAALEAVFLGVPSIYFDLDNNLNNNPLLRIKNNCFVNKIKSEDFFEDIIFKILKEKKRFQTDLSLIRKYFKSYFVPFSKNQEKKLVKIITNS